MRPYQLYNTVICLLNKVEVHFYDIETTMVQDKSAKDFSLKSDFRRLIDSVIEIIVW